jgi:kinesin family protein 6/9
MTSRRSVKVCIRTRPTHYFAQDNISIESDEKTVNVRARPMEVAAGTTDNRQGNFKFRFDHVFHNASQSNLYDLYCRDTVMGVVDGINGAIMTYGQTGSGKTFTMVLLF